VIGTLNSINTTYATGFTYTTAQQLSGFQYGNNLYASFAYSPDRLQLTCLDYSTTNRSGNCAHDGTSKFGLSYSYGASGANNGQVSNVTDSIDNGRNASYTYDALYRLVSANTTGSTAYPQWGLSWTYDRYGNRTAQTVTAGSGMPSNSVTVDATTNRIIGAPYSYDASGNMTNDGSNTLTWDGENRATSSVNGSNSGNYFYDGNGLRIKKVAVINGVTTTTIYVFSGTQVIAEYDNGAAVASPSREHIYSGRQKIATIQGATTTYQHSDLLSARILTDINGNLVGQRGHFPYGETWYETGTLTKVKFTTYERDDDSGNDYAMDRTYANRLGRFSSVDPLTGNMSDPQSLNRYTYALNDPINLVDPLGDSDGSSCLGDICGLSEGGGPGGGASAGAGGNSCMLDGVETPCSVVGDLINSGAGVACPDLDCSARVGSNGYIYSVIQDWEDGGWAYVNPVTGSLFSGGDELGLPPLDNPDPRLITGTVFPKGAFKAIQLVLNPDCARFLQGVGQAALLTAAGMKPGAPFMPNETGQYIQSLYDNYSGFAVALTAFSATAVNLPGVDPRDGNYHTAAEISGNNQITFYKTFNNFVPKAQAQALLHEATHLLSGGTDQQLAAAAGVPNGGNMSISEASSKFEQELEKHCK
jgi:RHS repeat-associated protein